MPLPSPRASEDQDAFISRCMGSDAMVSEYGDQEQRAAVCYRQWRGRKGRAAGERENKDFQGWTLKADAERGIVEAIVAVFGNVDLGDDVIHPGAFAKTIAERANRIRVLDMHKTDSVLRVIGKPLALKEVGRADLPVDLLARYPEATGGLWARTQFAMNTPAGRGAFDLLKEGMLSEWSIGYDATRVDYSDTVVDGRKRTVRNLREVALGEYSVVIWGMNPATDTLSAKEDAVSTIATLPAEAKEMTERGPVQRFGDVLQGTIHQAFTVLADSFYIRGKIDREQRIALSEVIGRSLDVLTQGIDPAIAQIECYYYPPPPGGYDLMAAPDPADTKAGRQISASNARELMAAYAALGQIIDRAGLMPHEEDEEEDEAHPKSATPTTPVVTPEPAPGTSEAKATPSDAATSAAPPPDHGRLRTEIDLYLAEIDLLEVA